MKTEVGGLAASLTKDNRQRRKSCAQVTGKRKLNAQRRGKDGGPCIFHNHCSLHNPMLASSIRMDDLLLHVLRLKKQRMLAEQG